MTILTMADRPLPEAADHIRRYSGLPWSGGSPETWAYAYFDALPTNSSAVEPLDVVSTAALHPKLTRRDLTWFSTHLSDLNGWLADTPDVDLAHADPSVLDELPRFAATGIELSLLTKVMHRKRPGLVPMLDRASLDWYRFKLHAKGAAAWPEYVRLLARDLAANEQALECLRAITPLRDLRLVDIAIWMENHG